MDESCLQSYRFINIMLMNGRCISYAKEKLIFILFLYRPRMVLGRSLKRGKGRNMVSNYLYFSLNIGALCCFAFAHLFNSLQASLQAGCIKQSAARFPPARFYHFLCCDVVSSCTERIRCGIRFE